MWIEADFLIYLFLQFETVEVWIKANFKIFYICCKGIHTHRFLYLPTASVSSSSFCHLLCFHRGNRISMARKDKIGSIISPVFISLFSLSPVHREIDPISPQFINPLAPASHCEDLCVLHLQEGSRRGQKVPQGVRRGAQGSVVHRLPLEKSLPTLPRLKAAAR